MTAKILDEPQIVQSDGSEKVFVEETPEKAYRKENSFLKELGALILKVVSIAVIFTLIFTFIYGFHRNIDPDMTPLVKNGDLVIFYRLDKNYAIGDLLLLDFQGNRQIRRVVARGGDVVDIKDGGLSVNGAIQQEPEIYQTTRAYENGVSFPLTVGEGQVFVLGDARENATDSRVYGSIKTDDTLGTVFTVIRRRGL
jgi:signal peptidase I